MIGGQELISAAQIAFLSLIFFQALAVLTMIAMIYATVNTGIGADVPASVTFENAPKLESVSTYLGLFILAEFVPGFPCRRETDQP